MVFRRLTTLLAAALLVAAGAADAAAQGGGLGTPNQQNEEATMGISQSQARVQTPFEQFAEKLKLDSKTQVPAVREIFLEAGKDAGQIGVEMLQLRQKLLNVTIAGNSDEIKATQDAYAAAAARMAALEATAFAKTYATLKPNQQSNAVQAFALIAGIFQPSAPAGGGGRGRRGGL